MADQLQLRGGTTNEHSTFTGALREVTVDTDKDTLIVHDAATAGGHPLLREDGSNSALSLGTAGTPSIKFTGDTNTGLYSPGADQVAISTGGTGRLFVDANGNVLVNTSTSPTAPIRLLVSGNAGVNSGSYVSFRGEFGNTDEPAAHAIKYDSGLSGLQYYGYGGHAYFAGGSERLRIDSSGRLLVGTSSALRTTIGRTIQSASTAGAYLALGRDESNPTANSAVASFEGYVKSGSTYAVAGSVAFETDGAVSSGDYPTRLVFSTTADGASSPTERMRIDSSGRVGIGTNDPGSFSSGGGEQLVVSNSGDCGITVHAGTSSLSRYLFADGTGAASYAGFAAYEHSTDSLRIGTASTDRVRIDSSGRVGVGTSSPTAALTVVGTNTSGAPVLHLVANANQGDYARMTFYRSDGTTSNAYINSDGSNGLQIGATNGPLNLQIGVNPALTIDTSRRVGVGTTSPQGLLHILGGGSQNLVLQNTAADARTCGIKNASGAMFIGSLGANGVSDIIFNRYGEVEAARIDSSGRVGIGTSSITGFSDYTTVQLGSSSSGSALRLVASGDTPGTDDFVIYKNTSGSYLRSFGDPIIFHGSSAEYARFDTSGRLGIGTTSPNGNLTVNLGSTDKNISFSGVQGEVGSVPALVAHTNAGALASMGFRGVDLRFATGSAERARIDSSGRLLVGTSTSRGDHGGNTSGAETNLQVEGTSFGTSSAAFIRNSNTSDDAEIILAKSRGTAVGGTTIVQNNDDVGTVLFEGADGAKFLVAASIKAAIDGTPGANDMPGRLVFSTTADGASSPTERMRIRNSGIIGTFADNTTDAFIISSQAAAGTSIAGINVRYAATGTITGTTSFQVFTNGNVQNTNNSYGAISDAKLKENIVDASSQWDDLKAIQIRNYNFKEGQTHTQIGVVAQEVELVSPGLVSESPDKDAEGNDLGTVTKSVNYSVLYMKAVKALQEAMERIETLEAKVAALESA